MFRHRVCAVIVTCVGAVVMGLTGCRPREETPADGRIRPDAGSTSEAPHIAESGPPVAKWKDGAYSVDGGATWVEAEEQGRDQLPDAELKVRMSRPIEESIYDPTLTKGEKLDLLLRHYQRNDNIVTEPDELFRIVMSEGMTDLEAANYWAVEGGSHEWAVYHAEAALRSDPNSVEALALWARELPRDRANESQAAFMAVLERDPTHRYALVNLAGATMMDQPFESMEYAKRLLDTYPDSGRGYLFMGQTHERLGDPDTAASYYEAGLKVAPDDGALQGSLVSLNNGRSWIKPIEPAQQTAAPGNLPDRRSSATTDPPEEPSPRAPASETVGPQTPESVERYQNALNEYRVMAGRFENVTGRQYQGVQDFGDYPEESSNWMAWRYMELGQQYLDAGHPEEAANVFRSATRQFPDDALIRQRGERMERSR